MFRLQIALSLAVAIPAWRRADVWQARACHSDDQFMAWAIQHQRIGLSWYSRHDTASRSFWARAGLSAGDTTEIRPVTDDSLCARAGVTVNRDRGLPDSTTRHIYLITEGRFFLALDPALAGGEFHTGYLLDSTLSKVLERLAM